MDISHQLREAIEATPVVFDGRSYRMRVVSVEPDQPEPIEAIGARIEVETIHAGRPKRAACLFTLDNLDDLRHVTGSLAETMGEVLAGDLLPGEKRIL